MSYVVVKHDSWFGCIVFSGRIIIHIITESNSFLYTILSTRCKYPVGGILCKLLRCRIVLIIKETRYVCGDFLFVFVSSHNYDSLKEGRLESMLLVHCEELKIGKPGVRPDVVN